MVKEHIQMVKLVKKYYWIKKFNVYYTMYKLRWFKWWDEKNELNFGTLLSIPFYYVKMILLKNKNINFFLKNKIQKQLFLNKKKKNIYIIYLKKTRLNYLLSLVNYYDGNILFQSSAGCCNIKTKKLKKSRDTFELVILDFIKKCKSQNIKKIMGLNFISSVKKVTLRAFLFYIGKIKNLFKWNSSMILKFQYLYIKKIIAHNGIRARKKRRI